MSAQVGDLSPRITLGLGHAKQHLEELVPDLQEPIAITVGGRRAAVLVPYAQYVELLRALAELAGPPADDSSALP